MADLGAELSEHYKRFLKYNQIRKNRLFEIMPQNKRPLFDALSFLLHSNLKGLPGYVNSDETPYGIDRFEFSNDLMGTLQKLFPDNSELGRGPGHFHNDSCHIISLLLMGSLGSVAQNRKSDFDYWVCINENKMSPNQLKMLKKKLISVEQWAEDEHDIEVHFFPTDIEKAQKNNFGETDKESAGSSQARLLKEEFYRTTILVEGKIPFWWLTPPGANNDEYLKYKEAAKSSPNFDSSVLVDLGNLYELTTEEFFGGALWQMNKAMDSPYKSVLKMAMLEGFLEAGARTQLLCNVIKNNVYEKTPEKDNYEGLDPYVTMFDHILNYYAKKKRNDIVILLQTCFYIKSGFKVKRTDLHRQDLNFKEIIILDYVKKWGWDQNKLDDLNNFKEWGFEKVSALGKQVHNFLIETYKNMADRLKKETNAKQIINDQDMTVLGRKLFSFYSTKAGKVQLMKKAFDEGLWQENITFSGEQNKQMKIVWSIYRGQVPKRALAVPDTKNKMLRQNLDITNNVVWAVFNQMLDNKTSLYYIPNPSPVSLINIQELINTILENFPLTKISSLSNSDLLSHSRITKMLIVANFDSPEWKEEIDKISIIYATSWGEYFCETYGAKEGKEKITKYLSEGKPEDMAALIKNIKIYTPKRQFSKKIHSALKSEIIRNTGKKKVNLIF